VASASEGVDIRVGIPLAVRNTLTELKLIELRRDYCVPPYVVLRLPTAADVVRYPPEGSVMIFTDMYQHGLRLPLHPWVQMMLAKLGYAPGSIIPTSGFCFMECTLLGGWLGWESQHSSSSCTCTQFQSNRGLLAGYKLIAERQKREVILLVISLPRRSLGGTGGSVKWGPISKEQEDEVERVRSSLSETERERKNLVTQENLYESGLLQGMASIIKGSTKVVTDLDDPEMQKLLRESRAKKVEKGGAQRAAGKRPMNDEGRVADVLGKKRALEEAHKSVMGTEPRLPPLDPKVPPKLPFGMDDVYAEGVEKMDFSELRRQKKEVKLAMHRQEVPLVNVFLEGVKSDPEVLAKIPANSYAARVQKTLLTQAYGYGEMYMHMAKADKEIQKLKRRNEMAKDKIAEAQEAIQEKNTLALQMAKMKRSRAEEVAIARAEAIESFRGSEELKSYIRNRMVAMQMHWEDRVARFNPSVRIDFDTSGEPPSPSPSTDDMAVAPESEPATGDAPSTES
ncbi:unnamed protein product, partial [Prunus brigantina]